MTPIVAVAGPGLSAADSRIGAATMGHKRELKRDCILVMVTAPSLLSAPADDEEDDKDEDCMILSDASELEDSDFARFD